MPALVRKVMGAGIAAGLANVMLGDVQNSLTASGTGQSDAQAIGAAIVRFTTVASGAGGVLPAGAIGDEVLVINAGANALSLYPPVGHAINAGATNAALSVGTTSSVIVKRISNLLWIAQDASQLLFLQSGTGAIAETMQSRERWVVNVTDFMTDAQRAEVRSGTVTLDVTAAWQAAHDALPSATGGVIFAPQGVHLLNQTAQSAQFTISKSNIEVRGAGWGTVLRHTATGVVSGNQAVVMVRPTGGSITNIVLRDFRVLGPTTNSGATATSDSRVVGVMLHDGVSTGDVTDVLVENVLVEGMESLCFGITSGAATTDLVERATFRGCRARNTRLSGFNDFGGNGVDIHIIDCHATDCDGFGMEMACTSLIIEDCIIRRCGQAGIGLEYNVTLGANNRRVVRNNTVSDIGNASYTTAPGITCGQDVNPFNTEIHGNSVSRTEGHGISVLLTPSYISIHDNDIYDVGGGGTDMRGVQVPGAATYTTIKNNTIITTAAGYAMEYGAVIAGAGSATNLIADNNVVGETVQKVFSQKPTRAKRNIQPYVSSGQAQNTDTGEDDLLSYTLSARTLEAAYQGLKITAWGTTAANANNKQVKLYLGNLQLFATGALGANDKDWRIEATLVRTTTALIMDCIAAGNFNATQIAPDRVSSVNRNFDANQTIKLTGEATDTADIVQTGLIIEFIDESSAA